MKSVLAQIYVLDCWPVQGVPLPEESWNRLSHDPEQEEVGIDNRWMDIYAFNSARLDYYNSCVDIKQLFRRLLEQNAANGPLIGTWQCDLKASVVASHHWLSLQDRLYYSF